MTKEQQDAKKQAERRERIATAAITGTAAAGADHPGDVARRAVAVADALIAALDAARE